MKPIHLAFLWHQHQPFYKDAATNRYVLPWVRLHAIKDYIGMLLVLQEFPDIRCTINLVPSLIIQIQDYAAGTAEDDALRLTRKPAADLGKKDCAHVLEHFFAGNPDRLIRPFPRYNELYERRNLGLKSGLIPAGLFSPQEFRDIQVWSTLSWFHPLVVGSDPVLGELIAKGRDFTEEDKTAMLARHDDVIQRVLPLHRELAKAGQIEISTTPFYHPILPLLCNMESARESQPDLPMPNKVRGLGEDAAVQVRRAIEFHEQVFSKAPTGLWPAEGSVSMDMLSLLQGMGLQWIATDEQILARSSNVNLDRDESAVLHEPDDLYQPYALPGEGLPAIVFRDHALADAIGFEYHRGDPKAGAENFVWRVEESARRCKGKPRLAPVILDGENPWDYYGQAGLVFLRELYTRLSKSNLVATTTLTDYIETHPPTRQLERLAAGSWIDGTFSIWIGHEADREAWNLLSDAREALVQSVEVSPPPDDESLRQAWEQIYIAEGSDWCWWFGPDHTSKEDYLFDELFRSHLSHAYALIGERPPPALEYPIGKPEKTGVCTQPTKLLNIVLDGKETDSSEWAAAGQCAAFAEGSAMHRAESGFARSLYYGFDADHIFIRLDADRNFHETVPTDARILVRFSKPRTVLLHCDRFPDRPPVLRVLNAGGQLIDELVTAAEDQVLELGCPMNLLAARPGDEIKFHVKVVRVGAETQRIPKQGAIQTTAPSADC